MTNHKLKSKFFTLIVPCLFLALSCETKDDSVNTETTAIHRLTDEDIAAVSNTIKTKDAELEAKRSGSTKKVTT